MGLRGIMLVCLLALGHGAFAQGILEGRVTDSLGVPLVAVSILVQALPDSTRANAGITSGDGRFSLRVVHAGEYLVRFRALSFHPVQQTVSVKPGSMNRRYGLPVVMRCGSV